MKYEVNGKQYEVEFLAAEDDLQVVSVNGRTYRVRTAAAPVRPAAASQAAAQPQAKTTTAATAQAAQPAVAAVAVEAGQRAVQAPMPGTVLAVNVAVGDRVSAGQSLVVLESMKMENDIPSPVDSVVAQVLVEKGQKVASGKTMIVLGETS